MMKDDMFKFKAIVFLEACRFLKLSFIVVALA